MVMPNLQRAFHQPSRMHNLPRPLLRVLRGPQPQMSSLPKPPELGPEPADSEDFAGNDGQVQALPLQQTPPEGRPGRARADLRAGSDPLQKQSELRAYLPKGPRSPPWPAVCLQACRLPVCLWQVNRVL